MDEIDQQETTPELEELSRVVRGESSLEDLAVYNQQRRVGNRSPRKRGKYFIICPNPNCGYRGDAREKSGGSILVLLVLLMIGILPGILYAILHEKDHLICPNCRTKAREI